MKRWWVVLCALIISACGGGGSSAGVGTTTPPTQPPPAAGPNDAPVASFTVSNLTPNEGETFLIDARTSYDPDGTILSFTAEHDFNPGFPELQAMRVNVDAHPQGVFEFLTPEVFGDTSAVFKITVKDDDGATDTDTAILTFRSTLSIPKIDGFGEPYRVHDAGRPLRVLATDLHNIFAVDAGPQTELVNKEILIPTGTYEITRNSLATDSSVIGEVDTVDKLIPYALRFDLEPVTPFQFVVVSEASNSIHWFADFDPVYPDAFELKQTIDIERPCHLRTRYSTGQDFVWVGQRGGGLSVVQLERTVPTDLPDGTPNSHWARGFNYSVKSKAGGNRSLCHVYPVVLSDRLSNVFPQTNIHLQDLIAVDYDSNELVLFADDQGEDEIYELVDVIPLETNGVSGLNIVSTLSVGNPSLFPQYIVILMSDGIHNGHHQVVVVYPERSTNEIMQSVYTFEGGVPIQMISPGSLFGPEGRLIDWGGELVIITSTSSEAIILEDERAEVETDQGPPIYKPAQYLDVGMGAGSVVPLEALIEGRFFRRGIVISYPESNELKLWFYRD